jgi:polysaccharide biosynthesis transport protein
MADIESLDDPDGLRQYLRILWRRRWVVVIVTLVAIAGALGYCAVSQRVYQATAVLQLEPPLPNTLLQATNAAYSSQAVVDVPTDIEVIESGAVSSLVRKTVPDAPAATATEAGTSELGTSYVVDVSVDSTNAHLAARAATAYATDYVKYSQKQTTSTLATASAQVQAHLSSVEKTVQQLSSEVAAVGSSPALDEELSAIQGALTDEASILQNELSTYQTLTLDQVGGSGTVLAAASVPTKPVKPKTTEYTIFGALIGLVLGLGAALAIEYFDDGIRTKEELERVARDRPVLALVPDLSEWRASSRPYLVSAAAPGSAAAESYRNLRTSIDFLRIEHSFRTLQITSPTQGEGKTATAANLALVMAQAGLRVALVCGDLRRPRLHEFFGLSNHVGLTSVLLQQTPLDEALQAVPGLEHLRLLASGPIPPNPSELLSGSRSLDILRTLADDSDLVLIDTPPVLQFSDAAALAGRIDGLILVASAHGSTRGQVARSVERLAQVEASIIGTVLNRSSEAVDEQAPLRSALASFRPNGHGAYKAGLSVSSGSRNPAG